MTLKYLRYYFTSKTNHSIHSPFIFELLTEIIQDKTPFYAYKNIEKIRNHLMSNDTAIQVTDLGAGSKLKIGSAKRKISDIAKHAAIKPKYGQLLFRLANRFKPNTILELGTSLGIGTMYLASTDKNTKVVTMECCPNTSVVAQNNFKKLNLKNIELIRGNLDETLAMVLEKVNQLDFAFFDGNHQKKPTQNYFEQCLAKAHNDSVFVFDDIHWSEGMEQAWKAIKSNEKVTITVDLFSMGLVFFRKEQKKEDFVLRF
ncbi:MAG: SAM-dependent methyltransferase [Flavobacteriales bacterium]|nr:MAG: SAM-dependent methyltransferase [Flavobacteriales bacterium]